MTTKQKSPDKKILFYFKKWESPIGDLYLYASDKSLVALLYSSLEGEFISKENLLIKNTISQLKEYFKGKRKTFSIPLDPEGTEFQIKAWGRLKKIPYGQTISYREQAESIGAQKAFRAVGTANGHNPISIIVPCHRVISSNGKISGYAGGATIKSQLLALEGFKFESRPKDNRPV